MAISRSSSKSSATHRIKLSEWQRKFILDGFDDYLRIACTGISAGKSRALALWLVMQIVRKPGCRCIAIAQTHKALKRVLIRELKVVCALLGIAYKYNKTEQEFSIGSSVVFGYSGENPEAILGLSEIDILVIDEAAYICEEAYQYASDRMRGGKYPPMVRLISSAPHQLSAEHERRELVLGHRPKESRLRCQGFGSRQSFHFGQVQAGTQGPLRRRLQPLPSAGAWRDIRLRCRLADRHA